MTVSQEKTALMRGAQTTKEGEEKSGG